MCKYYIYRFKNQDGEIIYIGKTNNINSRMNIHFSKNGHLKLEQYKQVEKIEYSELKSKAEMDIKELYYINEINPIFNKVNKREEEPSISFLNITDDWLTYEINGTQMNYKSFLEKNIKAVERAMINKKKKYTEDELFLLDISTYMEDRFHGKFKTYFDNIIEIIKNNVTTSNMEENFLLIRNKIDEYVTSQKLVPKSKKYYNPVLIMFLYAKCHAELWFRNVLKNKHRDKEYFENFKKHCDFWFLIETEERKLFDIESWFEDTPYQNHYSRHMFVQMMIYFIKPELYKIYADDMEVPENTRSKQLMGINHILEIYLKDMKKLKAS